MAWLHGESTGVSLSCSQPRSCYLANQAEACVSGGEGEKSPPEGERGREREGGEREGVGGD